MDSHKLCTTSSITDSEKIEGGARVYNCVKRQMVPNSYCIVKLTYEIENLTCTRKHYNNSEVCKIEMLIDEMKANFILILSMMK